MRNISAPQRSQITASLAVRADGAQAGGGLVGAETGAVGLPDSFMAVIIGPPRAGRARLETSVFWRSDVSALHPILGIRESHGRAGDHAEPLGLPAQQCSQI